LVININKENILFKNLHNFIFFIILMKLIVKHALIVTSTFFIILWFQNKDDVKYNVKRIGNYDKYKFPVLVSAIIGLLMQLPAILNKCDTCHLQLAIINPIEECNNELSKSDMVKPFIKNIISDQQIYTDLPDF
jgi:formate hydrogenlyase subunit 3/multisubunit Na+/H+ antiporter MnhD subunit